MADLATIEQALRKADAMARQGDAQAAQDAKRLADAYRSMSAAEPAPAPAQAASEGPGWRDMAKAAAAVSMYPVTSTAATLRQGLSGLGQAAEGIYNDISGGLQGVNPVSMAEQRGQAVGVLRDGYVDVDGVREPLDRYPADRFVTRQEGGQTYVYPRTEEVSENRLASAGRLLGYGVANNMGNALRGADAPPAQSMSQDAADLGITPSFGMRNTTAGKVAAAGEQFAPTASRFRQDAQRATGEMADAAFKLADRAGPGATPFEAGTAIQKGGESFKSGIKVRRDLLWDAVGKAIPKQTSVQTPRTLEILAGEAEKLRKLPNTIDAKRLQALNDGTLTWEQARALRTDIGTAMRSFDGSETNVAKGQLDQIYKALTQDLEATVTAAGPEAARAWRTANTYHRVSQARIDEAFGKMLGDKVTPEMAYDRLIGMASEGGSRANIASINSLFKSLPKDDAATVAGTVIRRMGQARAGAQDAAGEVFSPEVFLTNWNKMSKPARSIIGRSGLDSGVGEELTKLARVIEKAKEAGTFRNFSNTGNAVTAGALGAAAWTAPVSTATVAGLSHLSARALTNREFLRALNDFAIRRQSGALMRIARSESPLAIEAATILRLPAPEAASPQSQPTAGVPAIR